MSAACAGTTAWQVPPITSTTQRQPEVCRVPCTESHSPKPREGTCDRATPFPACRASSSCPTSYPVHAAPPLGSITCTQDRWYAIVKASVVHNGYRPGACSVRPASYRPGNRPGACSVSTRLTARRLLCMNRPGYRLGACSV